VLAWPMTLASRVSAFNWPLDSLELLYIVDLVKKLFVTGYGARRWGLPAASCPCAWMQLRR
jgi:hypothetical protein